MRAILNRYHEEQVWSDKIRSASTYGSLLALGINVVVFVVAIVLVEPYKRRRLAETFEKRIEEIQKENAAMIQGGMASLTEHFERQEAVISQIASMAFASPPSLTVTSTDEAVPPASDTSISNPPPTPFPSIAKTKERELLKTIGSVALGGALAFACTVFVQS